MATAPPPQRQQQLHGVVIITLPPEDDPSKGKTIAAYAFSDVENRSSPSVPSPARRERRSLPPSSLRRKLFFVLFVAVLAAACLASYGAPRSLADFLTGAEEMRQDRNETSRSFLLKLYPKSRGRVLRESGDVKLEARRRVFDRALDRSVAAVTGPGSSNSGSKNSSALLPLKGHVYPDGLYYTIIHVGNPPRPYFLDVDTGSDLTWIQCDAPCTNCAKGPHPLYKPSTSKIVPPRDSLCQELNGNQNYCDTCRQCDYEVQYADQSSSMGVLARDDLHLINTDGDKDKLSIVFGCAYDQQGSLLASPAKTDGILGLSSAKISLPSQLASEGIVANVIGHCITTDPLGGGYMFLGDSYVPRWGMTWVHARKNLANLYITNVNIVSYAEQKLNMAWPGGKLIQVIFDSGSSFTYFPHSLYYNLISSLEYRLSGLVRDESDKTMPLCWKVDFPISSIDDIKEHFKPLRLHFSKRWWVLPTTFTIPPEGYLIISDKGNVCLGILNSKELQYGSTIIIGDVSLRGKIVVYDNNKDMIGWRHSDCTTPSNPWTSDFPFFF